MGILMTLLTAAVMVSEMNIPFAVNDNKGWIPDNTNFTVEICSVDDSPLPDVTSLSVPASGEGEFGPFVFDEPGNYEYVINEIAYDDENIIFDDTVYHVYATVVYNDNDELISSFSLGKDGSSVKPSMVLFNNDYSVEPSEPDISQDGSSEDPADHTNDQDHVKDPITDIILPRTGGGVVIRISGIVFAAAILMLINRRKDPNDGGDSSKK